jgi:phosphoglycolate/pyridoxal phosphate phosphatase family enzyme
VILAQAFSNFVLDLDGVVWRGSRPIPNAPETVAALREAGKTVLYVTNNSGQSPAALAEKLSAMGAPAAKTDVITSAAAAALLITRTVPALRGRLAYVIGGPGLVEAMEGLGLRIVEGKEAGDASLVVVGIDKKLTYDKLRHAARAIRSGAVFVATNTDPTLPDADGLWPGAGSIVAALRTATGVEPLVAGKPHAPMLEVARDRLGGPALVVGDRVDTDVLGAQAAEWPSALVLTGATGLAELAAARAWPDFLLADLSMLLRDLPHPAVRQAAGPDLPTIATLLHDGGLPAGSARERVGRTVVAELDRTVLATAAWEALDGPALLRSVATSPKARGHGLGVHVVAGALRGIHRAGLRDVYLVTQDAERFFGRCGFTTVPREEMPNAVARHPQVARECPSTAPVMRMRLPDHA